MNNRSLTYYLFILIACVGLQCVKSYHPRNWRAETIISWLTGFINTGANQSTTITLGRSRNLTDSTVISEPELNANVSIKSDNGTIYTLTSNGSGIYSSAPLNLDNTKTYQLVITTSRGTI